MIRSRVSLAQLMSLGSSSTRVCNIIQSSQIFGKKILPAIIFCTVALGSVRSSSTGGALPNGPSRSEDIYVAFS